MLLDQKGFSDSFRGLFKLESTSIVIAEDESAVNAAGARWSGLRGEDFDPFSPRFHEGSSPSLPSINPVLTFIHEQDHLKVLSSTPVGLLLWRIEQCLSVDAFYLQRRLPHVTINRHPTLLDAWWEESKSLNAHPDKDGVIVHTAHGAMVTRHFLRLLLDRTVATVGEFVEVANYAFEYLALRSGLPLHAHPRWASKLDPKQPLIPPGSHSLIEIIEASARARELSKVIGGKASHDGSASLVDAMLWAYRGGANVISMSLGIDFPGFVERLVQTQGLRIPQATSIALEAYGANIRIFERLANFLTVAESNNPILIVAASGNESGRDEKPPFEINVAPPAAAPGFVAVGALEQSRSGFRVAPFSNTRVTIAAPGVNIISAKQGGGLQALSGTSMATPHVAGVAALWIQKLRADGSLSPHILPARVIGSGTFAGLVAGTDPFDVGAGLAQAPLG